jgi:hypothetical protein
LHNCWRIGWVVCGLYFEWGEEVKKTVKEKVKKEVNKRSEQKQ